MVIGIARGSLADPSAVLRTGLDTQMQLAVMLGFLNSEHDALNQQIELEDY